MTHRLTQHRMLAAAALIVVLPLAVLTRVGWRPLTDLDLATDRRAHELVLSTHWLLTAARALTHLGDPLVVTLLAVAAAVACALVRHRGAAIYLLLVRVVAVVVGTGLKDVVRRTRPQLPSPVAHAGGFSFPSGHALGAAALYASLAVVVAGRVPKPARVAVGVVPALVVATTRVLLGVHFPSDVVAGLACGWIVALLFAPVL